MMQKGKYIIFEGPEGSGKTTQIRYAQNYLKEKGIHSIHTREPGGTHIGEKIRAILLNWESKEMNDTTELLLYSADRAQHQSEIIIPALKKGYFILGDRGPTSSLAYQGYARGLDKELIKKLNNIALKGKKPDLEFILGTEKIDYWLQRAIKQSQKKGIIDRLEKEKIKFHEKVMKGYLEIARQNPDTHIIIWDKYGDRTPENIHEEIRYYLDKRLKI